MDFKDLLRRANLKTIEDFLIYDIDSFETSPKKSYSRRLEEAKQNAINFFNARYKDIKEFDEIVGYFNEQTYVFQEVYFEIGLITGAKIAYQICERIKELE